MFYKYELRNIGNKQALYLYLSTSTEEADEFKYSKKEKIENKIKNFINQNKINYEEGNIYIISNGIIIKSLDIKKDINIEKINKKNIYEDNEFIVNIKYNNNKIIKKTLKEYLKGAIFTSKLYNYDLEILKAITVLYRTYIYKKMDENNFIDVKDCFIKYKSESFYKISLYKIYKDIEKKIEKSINETNSTYVTYNSKYINPYIHNCNNGTTDTKQGVDYLVKTNSLWDILSTSYISTNRMSLNKIKSILNINNNDINNIEIISLTEGNCINKIKFGKLILTGDELMSKLNLPSKDMTILLNKDEIIFINRGNGNNLGLSLEGSKALAKYDSNYLQILNYYFPKCKIKKYI